MLNFKLVNCKFLSFEKKIIIEGNFVPCRKTVSVQKKKKMVIFHKLDISELWLMDTTWNKVKCYSEYPVVSGRTAKAANVSH